MATGNRVFKTLFAAGLALAVAGQVAAQLPAEKPVDLLPKTMLPADPATPPVPQPPVPVAPPPRVLQVWPKADATALLAVIDSVAKRGLVPADYEPEAFRAAIVGGEGDLLNAVADRVFTRLVTDLRDGRTPAEARVQWLVKDPDAALYPVDSVMRVALLSHDIETALASIEPDSPDYAALKAELAKTPVTDIKKINLIKTNLERWRWLPRTLGTRYLIANVPEYMLRVMDRGKILAKYRVIVGKKSTATPQLSALAQGVVVHPPWYLPQSIIKESVGALIANNPAGAKAQGYTWTGEGKTLAVIQQAGPKSALGFIKIDMPNPDAIFIHDTPNRHLFDRTERAFSHGCLRTERAMELGILLGILQSGASAEELADLIKAGKTQKHLFKTSVPVFISYFTMATGVDGKLQSYVDIYGRDAPVVAAFAKARVDPVAALPPTGG